MSKFGFSWSWKRALGLTSAKAKISREIGIPLTRAGRDRKVGSWLLGDTRHEAHEHHGPHRPREKSHPIGWGLIFALAGLFVYNALMSGYNPTPTYTPIGHPALQTARNADNGPTHR